MAILAIFALTLISCKSNKSKDTYEVTVDNTAIGGKLSKYFSLVDKTYKYKKGIIDKVIVELNCIEPLPEYMKAYIGVEVLDEDGTIISAGKPNALSFNNYEVLRQASPNQTIAVEIENHQNVRDENPAKIRLSSVVEEETSANRSYSSNNDNVNNEQYVYANDPDGWVNVRVSNNSSSDILGRLYNEGEPAIYVSEKGNWYEVNFNGEIGYVYKNNSRLDTKINNSNTSLVDVFSSMYSNTPNSSGSEDWDALLDSYEQYVDKYISFAKKVNNGDLSALTEYTSLMQKTNDLGEKMQNAKSEMSASQLARYMKILNKMAKVVDNLP